MDWIKKKPAQFALVIVAFLAIAATALLYTKVSAFDSNFDGIRGMVSSNAPVPPLDTTPLDAARKAIGEPVTWQPAKGSGKLLMSKLYALKGGKLLRPDLEGSMFHPPIPNEWLIKYKLDPLSNTVLDEDPDQDGFTTIEEWNGLDARSHLDMAGNRVMGADGNPLPDDSTDPTRADSRPPYHTKLEMLRVDYKPFRLRMMSYDINPRNPADVTVQINTVDGGSRTYFLEIGKTIPGTSFKVESFQSKEVPGKDGTTRDVSEVTIMNKETGAKVVLPLKQVVDSPDSNGIFRYKWVKPGGQATPDFMKRRNETFTLPPENDKTYKLIEIKDQDANLLLPDGTKKILTAPK